MATAVIYYSFGGNTQKIAQYIQQKTGGDLVEINTVKPYTGTYNEIVNKGQREVESGYMPEIKALDVDLEKYDTIVLGSPVWWYTFAPAMKTFLHNANLSGKKVYPFATNGGWIGHTFKDFEEACVGADVKTGLNVHFEENKQRTSMAEIEDWVKGIQ